jgi:membrane protease YdiL (CAAX protease family)
MSTTALSAPRSAVDVALLAGVLGGALAVRMALAGPAGPSSVAGGVVFAVLLAVAAFAYRPAAGRRRWIVPAGLGGAALLVLPALVVHGGTGQLSMTGYAGWATATTFVATTEEAFLRGALFGALARWRGPDVAVVGAAAAFALLHLPLYGVGALPLDFAVGLLLGALRLVTGGWAAPAVAHAGADLVGWWLV